MKPAGLSLITWPVWAILMASAALVASSNIVPLAVIVVAFAVGGALVVGRRGRVILTVHALGVAAVFLFRALATFVFPQGNHGNLGLPELSLGPLTVFGNVSHHALSQAIISGAALAAVIAASGVVLALVPLADITAYLPRALGPLSTALGVSIAVLHSVSRQIEVSTRARLIRPHASRRAVLMSTLDGILVDSVTLATQLDVMGESKQNTSRTNWQRMMLSVLVLAVCAMVAQAAGYLEVSWGVTAVAVCLTVALWWRFERDVSHLRPLNVGPRDVTVMLTAVIALGLGAVASSQWATLVVATLFMTPLWCAGRERHVDSP